MHQSVPAKSGRLAIELGSLNRPFHHAEFPWLPTLEASATMPDKNALSSANPSAIFPFPRGNHSCAHGRRLSRS
jgi:hypothetical protein